MQLTRIPAGAKSTAKPRTMPMMAFPREQENDHDGAGLFAIIPTSDDLYVELSYDKEYG
jgi:hypothetical protein